MALIQGAVCLAFVGLVFVVGFGSGLEYQRRSDCAARGGRSLAIEGNFVCASHITTLQEP